MKDERVTIKKTTIIYIIAIIFLLFALNDLIGLLTDSRFKNGFLGLDLGFTKDGQEIDIMGWVGVFFQLYIGYNLFRLNSDGRSCALTLLWIWVVGAGIFLIVVLFPSESIEIGPTTVWLLGYSLQIDKLGIALLTVFIYLPLYGIPLYFLSRKDIKAFFENEKVS